MTASREAAPGPLPDIRILAGGPERFTQIIMKLANRPVALGRGRRAEWMTLFEAKLCLLSQQTGSDRRASIAFIKLVMAAAEKQEKERLHPRPWGAAEFALFNRILEQGSDAQFDAALRQYSGGLPQPEDLSEQDLMWVIEKTENASRKRRNNGK